MLWRCTRRYAPKPAEPKRVLMPTRPLEPAGPPPDMWGVQESRKHEAAAGAGGGGAKLSLVQIQAQVCIPCSLCGPRTAAAEPSR